jgi:formylglycine-generating enzyme
MPANIADIRPYLASAYSDEELITLCADYFRDVYDNFAAGMTKTAKIQLLLDHCQRRELVPNLLAALERDRPDQYGKRFAQAVVEPSTEQQSPKRNPRQVFISHAHEDAEFAHRLAADLAARGWRVWIAPDSIRPGEKWAEAIDRGLDESSIFILVLTPAAVTSGWVKTETYGAIELAHRGEMRFIPAEVVSCRPPMTWHAFQRIPFANRYESGLVVLLAAMGGMEAPPPQTAIARDMPNSMRQISASQPAVPKAAPDTPRPVGPTPNLLTITTPIHLKLVRVSAGEFLMGSDPKVDMDAFTDELLQHRLTLPEFYIGKYPVTNEQYAAFVKTGRQGAPKHWEKGEIPAGKGNHPVVNVSWRAAVAFCQWLSQASGKTIRLPSEAEWEKAARGRDGRIYPWGNDPPTKELCNFAGNVGDTTRVGQYPAGASPCSALDMAGNVWEWTGNLYRPYPYQSEDGRKSPDGEGKRVVRGGSWDFIQWYARCAVRYTNLADNYTDDFGFRVVVSLSDSVF